MSAETLERLRQALEAHVADETGDIVTSWMVLAETTTLDEMAKNAGAFYVEQRGNVFSLQGIAAIWLAKAAAPYTRGEDD